MTVSGCRTSHIASSIPLNFPVIANQWPLPLKQDCNIFENISFCTEIAATKLKQKQSNNSIQLKQVPTLHDTFLLITYIPACQLSSCFQRYQMNKLGDKAAAIAFHAFPRIASRKNKTFLLLRTPDASHQDKIAA